MPPPFAPGPMLPLRGAGLGAPPGADMAFGFDTTLGDGEAVATRFGDAEMILHWEMQERKIVRSS